MTHYLTPNLGCYDTTCWVSDSPCCARRSQSRTNHCRSAHQNAKLISNNMTQTKIQKRIRETNDFNEVRQCAYVLGTEKRRFLFKQLNYKGYKLIRRSKLRSMQISRRILSNKLTLELPTINSKTDQKPIFKSIFNRYCLACRDPPYKVRGTTNRMKPNLDPNSIQKTET